MAAFQYTGRDNKGAQVKGQIEAASAAAVAEQLARQQIIVTAIKPAKAAAANIGQLDVRELLEIGRAHV